MLLITQLFVRKFGSEGMQINLSGEGEAFNSISEFNNSMDWEK